MRILTKNEFSLIYFILFYYLILFYLIYFIILFYLIYFIHFILFILFSTNKLILSKKKKKEINKLISYYDKCHIKYE